MNIISYSYHICCIASTLSFSLILHNCVEVQKISIQHIDQRTEISLMTLMVKYCKYTSKTSSMSFILLNDPVIIKLVL